MTFLDVYPPVDTCPCRYLPLASSDQHAYLVAIKMELNKLCPGVPDGTPGRLRRYPIISVAAALKGPDALQKPSMINGLRSRSLVTAT
jgi:hypothetical protein